MGNSISVQSFPNPIAVKPKVDVSIEGTENDDKIKDVEGNDRISGKDGNDKLKGALGNDVLKGDAGDDKINGDFANDKLDGGAEMIYYKEKEVTARSKVDQVMTR